MSFIPLIIRTKNLFSSESALKYFLTQALASSVFLFSILIILLFRNFKIFNLNFYLIILISRTILIKIASAPFHFWLPRVIEGLEWNSIIILITWQKLAPLIIFSYCLNFYLLIYLVIFAIIFGSLGGLNQTSLRKLIAFSSINHLGWIIIRIITRETLWLSYYLFYCFLRFNVIFMFNNLKLININQTFYISNLNIIFKISIFVVLLSLGGLPPFLGFFPKWIVIEILVIKKIFFILIFMLFFTLITLFFYTRISYNALLINYNTINWNFKIFLFNKNFKTTILLTFLSLFGLIIINLIYIQI